MMRHWLLLIIALTGYRTHNFGISGRCSHQQSCPSRASGDLFLDLNAHSTVPLNTCYFKIHTFARIFFLHIPSLTDNFT